ncbi:hypothetical protein KC19_12G021200 [Ceratodon purpureus]|uniref:Uncharacterized protein n=1 Tax=Ceratodon purpureus TaxID=3225 RepID=A0A8T0G3S9_CERPU|nr:hypothetical protein KC19_12G021200 [Ceratodon purpureus]
METCKFRIMMDCDLCFTRYLFMSDFHSFRKSMDRKTQRVYTELELQVSRGISMLIDVIPNVTELHSCILKFLNYVKQGISMWRKSLRTTNERATRSSLLISRAKMIEPCK